MPGLSTPTAWPPHVPAPTLSERRGMKKAAQPEHSYTGYIPKWLHDDSEDPTPHRQRHAPILGYSGHLRHDEDRVGTTFAKGLEIAGRPQAAPAGPLTSSYHQPESNNNQTQGKGSAQKKVMFQAQGKKQHKTKAPHGRAPEPFSHDEGPEVHGDFQGRPTSARSGYGAFDNASGYGEFHAKPMSARSGYGAFDNASGYGEFQAKPQSTGSGYGAFENASGYGDFRAKPKSTGSGYGAFENASGYGEFRAKPNSAGSGYGAFDGASGYGEFQAKPKSTGSGYGAFDGASGYGDFQAKPASSGSGYGAFDGVSGYGQFAAPPSKPDPMSARSGYGAFDGASGYGEFQAKPRSGGSGYGEFDGASGYGAFLGRPEVENELGQSGTGSGYGAFGASVGYGDFLSRASGYGAFGDASGHGEFQSAPHTDTPSCPQPASPPPKRAMAVKQNDQLDRQYQRALRAVGGEANVEKLLDAFARTVAQRHHKRTELLQTIKRHFERHEQQSAFKGETDDRSQEGWLLMLVPDQGKMTKAHLKEALQGLACVFTDDQVRV
jgi:hypothetical protein